MLASVRKTGSAMTHSTLKAQLTRATRVQDKDARQRARIAQIEANRCKTPRCENNGELIMGMRAALCTECIAMPKEAK